MLTLEDAFLDELLSRWAALELPLECVLTRPSTRALLHYVDIPRAGFARVPSVQLGAQVRRWKLG